MRKYITVLFILTISFLSKSQILLKGKIIDKDTKTPVPYSTILEKNSSFGTIADSNGYFNLSINESLYNTDTLIISAIGYSSRIIESHELKDTLYLIKNIYELPEVLVHDSKIHSKSLGVKRLASKTGSFGIWGQSSAQIVLFIPNNNKLKAWVKSVSFHIKKNRGVPNTPFRIRIFDKNIDSEQPYKDILNKSIIISGDKNGGWVTANIDSLRIPFSKNGIFVGMEWLYDDNNYHYTRDFKGKVMNGFGQCISITNNIAEHRTWVRDLIKHDWILRDWWYSDYKRKKHPNNIMVRVKIEYYK